MKMFWYKLTCSILIVLSNKYCDGYLSRFVIFYLLLKLFKYKFYLFVSTFGFLLHWFIQHLK